MNYTAEEFLVPRLGKCIVRSPLNLSKEMEDGIFNYIEDDERIIVRSTVKYYKECIQDNIEPVSFEKAGPKN
jgi:6-phosphofructokinase 1